MSDPQTVFIVDDDRAVLDALSCLLQAEGFAVECFESAEAYRGAVRCDRPGCLVLDVRLPGLGGIELLHRLSTTCRVRATIVISGHADVATAVQAMKLGAVHFLEKPFDPQELIESVKEATRIELRQRTGDHYRKRVQSLLETLSADERQVMAGIFRGLTNQQIADELQVSLRTAQLRRTSLFQKLGVDAKTELINLLLAVGWSPPPAGSASRE